MIWLRRFTIDSRNMDIHTGDIVMLAPALGKERLVQRAIQTMGSVSTHDEPVRVDLDGNATVGYASPPHFQEVPLDDRIDACDQGKSNMAIVRWHEWPENGYGAGNMKRRYCKWRGKMDAMIRLGDLMHWQYDTLALASMGWNLLRGKMGLNPRRFKHCEHKVFCTEICKLMFEAAGTDMMAALPPQKYLAPIHVERLFAIGQFRLVQDFGLVDRLTI